MLKKIKEHEAYRKLYSFLDSFQFQSGVSLLFIIKTFFYKMKEDDLQTMAGAIAFNFTLSLFPGIIFLFTLIPYIPVDNLTEYIQSFMQEGMPQSVYEFTWSTIEDIVAKPRGGLLSFGFVMALYLSKNGMLSIMTAFNNVYTTRDGRSFFKKQGVAVMLTIFFVFSIFLAVVVLVLGTQILDQTFNFLELEHQGLLYWSILSLRYFVILIMFLVIISLIYYFAPTVKSKFNFFSAGSFTATVLIIIVAKLFAFYVDNFGNYNKLYGSIGALLGLMAFFFAISLIILVGFQVNASIDKAKNDFYQNKN